MASPETFSLDPQGDAKRLKEERDAFADAGDARRQYLINQYSRIQTDKFGFGGNQGEGGEAHRIFQDQAANAGKVDLRQWERARRQELGARIAQQHGLDMYRAQAMGQGPSLAAEQMRGGLGSAYGQAAGMMAGGRGANMAAAQRAGMMAGSQGAMEGVRQAAQGRSAETMRAYGNLVNSQLRGSDAARAAQALEQEHAAAALRANTRLGYVGLENQLGGFEGEMKQKQIGTVDELMRGQMTMANQAKAAEIERNNRYIDAGLSSGAGALSAYKRSEGRKNRNSNQSPDEEG